MKNKQLIIIILLYITGLLRIFYYNNLLPKTVALHFGFTGTADNWGSKQSLLIFSLVILSAVFIVFIVCALSVKFIPDDFINLPNKQYWLSQDCRVFALEQIQNNILRLGSATLLFLIVVSEAVYLKNIYYYDL